MRVTQNTGFDVVRESIRKSRGRMENLQLQSATLKKLNTPSDDPVGSAKVLEIRTDKVNNEQFHLNAKLAETFLDNSDHVLSELADIAVRAKEIALSQSNGAGSNEQTRLGIAEEVAQLYYQAIAAANRRVGDRYLFSGYKTDRAPVDQDGRYLGDDNVMMVEIGKEVYLAMNVPGIEAFNSNPKGSVDYSRMKADPARNPAAAEGAESPEEEKPEDTAGPPNVNLFSELQSLRVGLLTGDVESVRGTLERFDSIQSKVVAERAKVGSRIQGLKSAIQTHERHNITNAELSSSLEDADMAQVVSDLAREETVFRSALASSQKLIQPTLIDFLR